MARRGETHSDGDWFRRAARIPLSDAIIVEGATKRYGPVVALAGVDLRVQMGEIVVLLGPNGAGKSTLLRILTTGVLPDNGRCVVAGHDVINDDGAVRRAIGFLLGDERSWYWRLSGRRNLLFFAALHGLRGAEASVTVSAALDAVDLADVADRRVDRYSSGMRARLAVARAILGEPQVLLLDEPFRSLDPLAAAEARDLVRKLVADRSVGALLTTHDLHEAAELGDRVVILNRGRVVSVVNDPADAASVERAFLEAT